LRAGVPDASADRFLREIAGCWWELVSYWRWGYGGALSQVAEPGYR